MAKDLSRLKAAPYDFSSDKPLHESPDVRSSMCLLIFFSAAETLKKEAPATLQTVCIYLRVFRDIFFAAQREQQR